MLEVQVQGRPKYGYWRSWALAARDQAATWRGLWVSEQATPGKPSTKLG